MRRVLGTRQLINDRAIGGVENQHAIGRVLNGSDVVGRAVCEVEERMHVGLKLGATAEHGPGIMNGRVGIDGDVCYVSVMQELRC